MKKTEKMKKMMAMITGVLMLSTGANAMVLENTFPTNEKIADFGWEYADTSAMRVSAEMSVLNGKLTWASLRNNYFVTPAGERGNFYKTFENDVNKGVVTFSVDITPVTKESIANGSEKYILKPTIELSDGSNIVAKVELAGNYQSMKVNNEFIASGRNEIVFSKGKTAKIDIVVDYTNDECYIMKDGNRISTTNGGDEYVAVPLLSDVAITRCDFKVSNANLNVDPILLDNISLYSSMIDSTIFEDDFDDVEKECMEEYGYYATKNAFLYRTEDGVHIKNANPDGLTAIWLTKGFDNISSGKAVFDFSLNVYNEDGITRTRPYDSKQYPMFSLNSGDTKRFYCVSVPGYTTVEALDINGTQIIPNLAGKAWADGFFSDIRLVVDVDNNLVDIYAKNPNTSEYQKVNKESLSMLAGTGIDSISFGREHFGGSSRPGYYHITDLKAYTVTEGGYTKPVIMEAGRTIVTEVAPGKTVDIYSAASNVINNSSAKLIVAYYDENDMFIEMDVADFTDKSTGVEIDISNVELLKTSYTFPSNAVAGSKFKAFIWNGMDDMIPLTASSEIEMPVAEVVE